MCARIFERSLVCLRYLQIKEILFNHIIIGEQLNIDTKKFLISIDLDLDKIIILHFSNLNVLLFSPNQILVIIFLVLYAKAH